MPEAQHPNWKREISQRLGDVDEAVLEELAQHLESRFEELGSAEAVMSEWSAESLRAELARIRRRDAIVPGNPASGLWQDVRYGWRQLRLNRGFAAVAIASLALGIGANTAIFQLLDAIRLRALPVERPQELAVVRLQDGVHRCCEFTSRYSQATSPMWEEFRRQQQAFSGVLAWGADTFNMADGGETHLAKNALWVSGDFFQTLGVHPLLGRVFSAADDQPGCASPGAVLSYGFWQREFAGNPSAIGRKLKLNGHPVEIVGVTPASFYGVEMGRAYDLAVPICSDPVISGEEVKVGHRDTWWLVMMGRLKPGWTMERASAHLRTISPGLFQATVDPTWDAKRAKDFEAFQLTAYPAAGGISDLRQQFENPLWMLLAISGSVLLIACANLANLLLARGAARQREIAVRLALGASRARLIRQLLVESLLLASLGAAAGAGLARVSSQMLVTFLGSNDSTLFMDLGADWRLFGFLAALAALTCILFGLTPALRATRISPNAAMKAGARGFSGGRERSGLRRVLVISQIAMSLVLLVTSLLFVRTLRNLLDLDAGFQQEGVVWTAIDFDKLGVPPAHRLAYRRDLLERIRAIPGVDSAAQTALVPIAGGSWRQPVHIHGTKDAPNAATSLNRVSDGYFKTFATPILAGRDFDARDTLQAPGAAMVNQEFARQLMNGANPVGHEFSIYGSHGETKLRIVGVVKDAKYLDLREKPVAVAYLSAGQDAFPDNYSQIVIRSSLPAGPLLNSVRDALHGMHPNLAFEFRVLQTDIRASLGKERLMALLSGLFGALALALASVGLYGVISYGVARRTQEIGVRMALGADALGISTMILREAAGLLVAGLAGGAAIAFYSLRFAEAMLYGLTPHDAWSFTLSAAVLTLVAAVASYLPARRAARLDPMVALREE
jgi:putative ABC transport system permease protein